MDEREQLIRQLVALIADYRERVVARPTEVHVERWLQQFPAEAQLNILREITFTLGRTYFSRERIVAEIRRMFGFQPSGVDFWRNVSLLNIQQGGNSQYEMVRIISDMVRQAYGFEPSVNGISNTYIYFDDGIFTGKRVEQDVSGWVQNDAPQRATLHIAAVYVHGYGKYEASRYLAGVVAAAGKDINIVWHENIYVEDRRYNTNISDVLRPTHAPLDQNVQAYIGGMRYQPIYRQPGSVGGLGFFSSCQGRSVLEQEFLKAGVRIRQMCPFLGVRQRPLGNSALETLGFGSMIVTYRNCPNNAPLALWAGDPWYPLFPRMTNAEAQDMRFFDAL